jgi:hypothetical protein
MEKPEIYTLLVRNNRPNENNVEEEYYIQIDTNLTKEAVASFEELFAPEQLEYMEELHSTFVLPIARAEEPLSSFLNALPVDRPNVRFHDVEFRIIQLKDEFATTFINDELDVEFYIEHVYLLPEE